MGAEENDESPREKSDDPTVDDDETEDFFPGSTWLNTATTSVASSSANPTPPVPPSGFHTCSKWCFVTNMPAIPESNVGVFLSVNVNGRVAG